MELECDLSKINNEELLRKMWQQSEDICRKKEIRTQLYKLRESRLRDLYQGDIMADNTVAGFGKDPLATSHGDALADQSFQSLKSKEIRDSLSPTEMKFQSMTLNNPNTTGWNVQSSKEVSPDGRGFRSETIATTDGVENINGGIAEFKGRNEQQSSAHHQGDDKNFVKKAMESSNSHLQEKVVMGDENSGRTEVRTSSSTSTSSSQVIQSSTNTEYDDGFSIQQAEPQKYLMDSSRPYQQDLKQRQLQDEQRLYEQQFQQQRQHHINQQERRTTEQSKTTRQNTEQKNISQNVQTQETHEQNKRYVDMDKASPEYQQHVQHLMQQPGEIISNTVEYPKPNVKMITTVKRLPDGTIVRNKRYETEEMTPTSTPTSRPASSAPNQTHIRHDSQQQQLNKTYEQKRAPHPSHRPSEDMVDSGTTTRYVQDSLTDDVETKFSSTKKSSRKFSTETTSETIQEYDDRYPHGEPSARPKSVTNDFSTHGFPSVKPNKPTQEYPSERPRFAQGFLSQAAPEPNEAVVPHYTDAVDNISERRIPTKDGEVIIVSSEKQRNFKTQTNSERIVETEHVVRDDQQDFTTHGFPSVREPGQQPKMYSSERQVQPQEQGFPLDKIPPGARIIKPTRSSYEQGDDETVVVSSQKSHTTKYNTNTERVIQHEIIRDDQGYPRSSANTDNLPYKVTTPGDQVTYGEFPGSPRKPANVDFSTQGFPSVRTPHKEAPGNYSPQGSNPDTPRKSTGNDFSTQGFPSVKTPSKPAAGLPSQNFSTHGFPSVRSPTKTTPTQGYPANGTNEPLRSTPKPRTPSPNKYKTPSSTTKETTERVIRKEKEVDSAHRAFAASLRSSSPIDHARRDSYTTDSHSKHTPRSSVTSTKNFRRDMREGSHDSAPSETSRISTTTITRNTPPRNVGGRTVVTRVVTTKTGHGSNDSLSMTSPRATKSPSPGKVVTTTTTTTRTTSKTPTPTRDVPKSTDNQHTRIIPTTISIPINETLQSKSKPQPPLTTISKIKISENHKLQPYPNKTKPTTNNRNTKPKAKVSSSLSSLIAPTAEAVVEEIIEKPCIKKHYYKLGPSDTLPIEKQKINTTITNTANTTYQPYKLSQTNEKSPVKKPLSSHQPQQAPRSRSSTPSYNNRKPTPTTKISTVMADNDDDRSPLLPSFSSRKPQTVYSPNVTDKTPQDDWQTRKPAADDERRTVNRETTFERCDNDKPLSPIEPSEMSSQPQYQQPNVEWVIVDDVDIEEHDVDDDDFTTEVVDSKIENVKKTTQNLIIKEKLTPKVPIKGQKTPNSTDKNRMPQTKLNDKMPQQVKTQKSLPDSRSPLHASLKSQPKIVDNKHLPKSSPKTPLASNVSSLKKPVTKVPSDLPTTVRKTLKSSAQVVKDTTTKLIEENRTSERLTKQPQSPLRKPKTENIKKSNEKPNQHTPISKGYPDHINEEETTTIIQTTADLKRNSKGPVLIIESLQEKPNDVDEEPSYGISHYDEHNKNKHDVKSNNQSPGFSDNELPVTETFEDRLPNRHSPQHQSQITHDKQKQQTAEYGKQEDTKPFAGSKKTPTEPLETNKDELVSEEETLVTTSKRTVAKHIQKFESNYFKDSSPNPLKGPKSPPKPLKNIQIQKKPIELAERRSQSPNKYTSPIGISKKPEIVDEDFERKPNYGDNDENVLETTITSVTKIEKSTYPNKKGTKDFKSPTKNQEKPEENFGRRPQSPKKHASPTRTPKKPVDNKNLKSSVKTKKQIFEEFPEKIIPKGREPLDTDDDEKVVETRSEFVINSTKKLIKTEQEFEEIENLLHPAVKTPNDSILGKKYPEESSQSPTSSPKRNQQILEENTNARPSGKRPQFPNKVLSSNRSPKKTEEANPLDSDYENTIVDTNEYVFKAEKNITTVSGSKSPVGEEPFEKRPKSPNKPVSPIRSPKKPENKKILKTPDNREYPEKSKPMGRPLFNDDKQTIVERNEFVINSTKKLIRNEQEIRENKHLLLPDEHTPKEKPDQKQTQQPKTYPNLSKPLNIERNSFSSSPCKSVSPTKTQSMPMDNTIFTTTLKNTIRDTSSSKTPKKPERSPSPSKPSSPSRIKTNPDEKYPVEDETYTTTLKTTKNIQVTKFVDDKNYPDKIKPTKPVEKLQSENKEPVNTDEEELVFKSKTRKESPIRPQQKSEQNLPESFSSPSKTSKKPERSPSPSKPKSPSRIQKNPDEKYPVGDETYTTTLKTTKNIQVTKFVEDKNYPDKIKPTKPVEKPKSENKEPLDTDEKETYSETQDLVIKSKTRKESPIRPQQKSEQNLPERYPSPSKTPKKPERSPSPSKPSSPSRIKKNPDEKYSVEDETYTTTLKTTKNIQVTKFVDDKNYPDKIKPTKPVEKPQSESKEPVNTDEEELVTKSKTRKESPIRPQQKSDQNLPESDGTSKKTLRNLDVVKTKVIETFDNENLPVKKQPEPRAKSPQKINTYTPDRDNSSTEPKPERFPGFEVEPTENITFTTSTDFSRNTSQQLIATEREIIESERKTPKRSQNRSPSPCIEKSPARGANLMKPVKERTLSPDSKLRKSTTAQDQKFQDTLRSSTILEDKETHRKLKEGANDETDSETEELLVETCENNYLKTENTSTKFKPDSLRPMQTKPEDKKVKTEIGSIIPEKPWNVPLTEFIETERKEIPDGAFISKTIEPVSPTSPTFRKKGAGRRDTFEERCRQILGMDTYGDTPGNYKQKPIPEIEDTTKTEITKNETPEKEDLKNTAVFQVKIEDCDEEDETLSINSSKRDLYKQIHTKENEPLKEKPDKPKNYTTSQEPELEDEVNKFVQPNTVQSKSPREQPHKSELKQNQPIKKTQKEPELNDDYNELVYTVIKTTAIHKKSDENTPSEPRKPHPENNTHQKPVLDDEEYKFSHKIIKTTTTETKSDETKPVKVVEGRSKNKTSIVPEFEDGENEFMHNVTKTTTVQKKFTKNQLDDDTNEPSEPETCISSKHIDKTLENQYETVNNDTKITEKYLPTSSPRSGSPTKDVTSPKSTSPTKKAMPIKETSKGKPDRDNIVPKTSPGKPSVKSETETATIKDRLRSSTRKTKTPPKPDQIDGSDNSSPEHSPSRLTERRRSSNISVNTEIIIEHTEMDTSSKKEKSPVTKRRQDSVYREIINSTVLPEKLVRRMPVTERKESAPVHRVTNKDKDSKMSRSTSENLIKVKKSEPSNHFPKASPKPMEHRSRPNKCFATKTINLSTTDRLTSSEDMENVVIDIQQAKSSREPSPDKIVPTPVPAHLDTGNPRYPDVIQEPEDDRPKRKPQVKNIPIFEEEQNSYVGCHITEIKVEKTESSYDSMDYDQQLLVNPVVEAPPSLDSNSLNKTNGDEESVLTVIEKVTKFQNIAEEVTKPKASEPFQSEYDDKAKVPEGDECLLTVDEKREKFLKTTENVVEIKEAKQVKNQNAYEEELEDEDHKEFVRNERIYTAKLQPMAPQKSPDLVRSISRHISRQNEVDDLNEQQQQPHNNLANKDYPLTNTNEDFLECFENQQQKYTKEFKVSHQQQQQRQSEKFISEKKYQQQPKQSGNNNDDRFNKHNDNNIPNSDDEELIPLTAKHTTIIEERRQKDILSRPSVFEGRNKKPTAVTSLECNKSPVKDTEKLRPDIKSRTQPTATTITTTTTSSNKPKQTTQHTSKKTGIDYEQLRGNNSNKTLETGVKNIIGKQTKVSSSSGNSEYGSRSSDKPNDLKKQSTNKKSETQNTTPVHLRPAQKTDDEDVSADEMIISTTEQITVRNEKYLDKEKREKTPLPKKTPQHSSTNSSPLQPLKFQTKEHHLEKLTNEIILLETNINETTFEERSPDIDETILEPSRKLQQQPYSKSPRMSTKASASSTTDSVAARRSLFENSTGGSGPTTPTKRTPLASPMSGRRPSYMEHTKSSLEHTRRDSLEINKSHYSRKSSQPEEETNTTDRNTAVKFNVPPHSKRPAVQRPPSTNEDINVEEIFDLEVLEKLLETIQSYEIRRRIRAQIRLIKKNQKNELISSTVVTAKTSTTKSDKPAVEEEPDTTTKQPKTPKENSPKHTSNKKEYIFDEAFHPPSRKSPSGKRYPSEKQEPRHHSPERKSETIRISSSTKKQYTYKDDYQHEKVNEIRHETSPSSDLSIRKPCSTHSSPDRQQTSPVSKSPIRNQERSRSPQSKPYRATGSSQHPDSKTSPSRRKSSTTTTSVTTSTKPLTKRVTTTTTTTTTSDTNDNKTPVWADRKNILKAPGTVTPKKAPTTTSSIDSRTGFTKSIKSSTTSQKLVTNKTSFVDDDCITSSYGIGPTDENGLPLFGIRALKKKKPQVEPSETTEEVTGYVVEEKYYADGKTKPTMERKEFIYSSNPEELQKLKEQAEVTSSTIKSLTDVDVKECRQAALISKPKVKGANPTLRSSPEDDFLDTTTKYGRRGSVKEMSEKFIQKEASSSTLTEKSNNYPKAGLILRTNSRKNSRDNDNESDNYETYKTTRVQHHSTVLGDSDEAEHEYEVEEVSSHHSGRFITESESECDSIKTQREIKKVTSSSSSSMATRSFLNSQGEEKIITNVSDCLQRMRNADNVVEEGDTAEDQEARALLNKFLGASIIMKGVESSLPASSSSSSNRQSKVITTKTTSSSNLSDDNDGDNTAKHEIKTTRITKTIKSGSSSSPVTYTTCDIEEIWDEEILKELLEQARTYEERRKIRSRLRELMADREETKKSPIGEKNAPASAPASAVVVSEEESSASEYEEIIEEVTDYSEAESDVNETPITIKTAPTKDQTEKEEKQSSSTALADKTQIFTNAEKSIKEVVSETDSKSEIKIVSETVIETEIVQEAKNTDDKSVTCEKGEFLNGQVVHDTEKAPKKSMLKEANHSNQKLKSSQANFSSKATSSESSSMHAPHNSKHQKTTSSTSSSISQNPIVTVQTAGRTDSNLVNKNSNSSSSLGGNSVVVGNDSPRQVDRLGVPQKEDSGTESGEDLRLIAAGLRDQLQIQSDSNIIEDVTFALSRLENSLNEGKDISIDSEKRKALLALVARLRAGLTSPEKLAEIAAAMSALDGAGDGLYGETSSPEADAHRSNRSRFSKRRNHVNRHTVGVSREELADARRYMEDMLIMSNNNLSQNTTPEANSANNNAPPQWYPIEKNASMGAILTESSTPILQRPRQFVPTDNVGQKYTSKLTVNNGKRRPLSGEYSVTFENLTDYKQDASNAQNSPKESSPRSKQNSSPDDSSRNSRFSNKKHLMKRANTIDLAKTHKYNSEFDTDSDAEDKGPNMGLKRAVQVSVKKRVQNVVPPFEPKTENDRKFLAFINKQSDKPGLGWTTSRSVSNWTNKFGSIKSTFEGGLAGKPPQAPHHVSTGKTFQNQKLYNQQPTTNRPAPVTNYISNQQIAQRLQEEAQRQTEERRKQFERERNRLEYERREREKLERQRQQREMLERERLEREHFERQRREQDQITAAQHAAILREQEQLTATLQNDNSMNVPKPLPINEFKHAPQSVFRPIDSVDAPAKTIYKPIPQLPRNVNNWQNVNTSATRGHQTTSSSLNASPSQYCNTRPDDSFITSPPPSSRSPNSLPWASKQGMNNSSFKTKTNRFEEASKYDRILRSGPYIQRHNSLRSSNVNANHINEDFRKRPSLPNTFDPYSIKQTPSTQQDPLAYLPPPQNISFTYSNLKPKANYQSYPCLPLAVDNNASDSVYHRSREDSLTNPHSVPLVLTSANPLYCPATTALKQQPGQPCLPKQFDLISPADSTPTSPSVYNMQQTDCTDDDFDSDNNLLEYHAVSRVMGKPQCQTAVTVGRRTGHVSDDELYGKNSRAAKNLLSTMKNIGSNSGNGKLKQTAIKRSEKITSPTLCLSPDGRSYQAPIVEPLFPEITKFETDRKPVYFDQEAAQNVNHAAQAPRKLKGMYKSMENLNRNGISNSFTQQPSPKPYVNQSNFIAQTQQPSYQAVASTQQISTKPYISETQTSYVVTYPKEDNTDDEDFSRQSLKAVQPSQTLDLRRQRNVSETSTGSSTTASISYNHNLPSPNTSWTSNPIVVNESSNYQAQFQTSQNNLQQPKHTEPTYQALSTQVTTTYTSTNSNAKYSTPSAEHLKKTLQNQTPTSQANPVPSTKSSYDSQLQRQLQQKQSTNQSPYEAQKQTQQYVEKTQKPLITQKPSMQPAEQISKASEKTSVSQEKRTVMSMRKTLSEDQTILNPQHSNISQEMLERLDQQRERISNETRRKSLGNALDYQMEKHARYETQQQIQQQQYKSSAPSDTPDIVKSSLPKDENQPILKKFGPPQRHHYMPNSYQSPTVNIVSYSRSVASSTLQTTKIQNKNLQQTNVASKTIIKTTGQKLANNTKPTVIETPATPQPDDDYIPRNIVYNNIHAFSTMARRQEDESLTSTQEIQHQIRPNKLSKSDSWKQIVMLQNQNNQPHSPKYNQSPTNELRRTKSGHTLALPKMYEAAMTKTDITEKQKTVAAYFSGQKSPIQSEMLAEQQKLQTTTATKRSVINRTKTSEKVSAASRKSLGSNLPIVFGGLTRSATMPHIANLNLLDESNVEDAFEQLIMEQKQNLSSSTTEKTETKEKDGAVVTTTTKVTTRTVTGTAANPVSPFNKFKQLDSQQSAKSPTTPTTPGGGNSTASPTSSGGNQPIFKFTDPALNARAATVKDQLLQWCQSKTQEYENVQITNFSTSWNNGLAFCALIHHFLPDAFDYSQLTPKNRRKNFELAFTVADEKAGIAPLLDVEDMVVMQRPDWKCVFVYVQSIYRRFRNCQ